MKNAKKMDLFEIAGGFIAKLRYQRSEGAFFNIPFEVE